MKQALKVIVVALVTVFSSQAAWAQLKIGEVPQTLELRDELGGRLDKTPWSSDEMKGKVHVLFYVDPDEADLNNETSEGLDKAKFPKEKFQSVAVINMAATWLPNFAISSKLKKKQKKYPRTIYVRDYKKEFVRAWNLSDDNSDVLAFDRKGRLVFRKDGKLEPDEIQKLLDVVRDNL